LSHSFLFFFFDEENQNKWCTNCFLTVKPTSNTIDLSHSLSLFHPARGKFYKIPEKKQGTMIKEARKSSGGMPKIAP
jgi:hypothetical protein